jgi:hypothetical protein
MSLLLFDSQARKAMGKVKTVTITHPERPCRWMEYMMDMAAKARMMGMDFSASATDR